MSSGNIWTGGGGEYANVEMEENSAVFGAVLEQNFSKLKFVRTVRNERAYFI